jgi:3-oxoacyl-(acyl-carrier-protein) synthase
MTRYTFLSTAALGDAMVHAEVALEPAEGRKDLVPPWEGSRRRGAYIASYTNSDKFDKYVRFAHHVIARKDDGVSIDDSQVPAAIKKFTAFEFLKLMNNMPTAHAGIQARCQGPVNTFLGTPAGGVQAIGRAYEAIRDDLADVMYAGGVGSSVHDQMMMVRATRGLNSDPEAEPAKAGRPFDTGATGIVPGEGGAILVLERASTAAERGAPVLAELAGYADWFAPPTSNRGLPAGPDAMVRAARKAMRLAGVDASEIDLVTSLGESDTDLDAIEASGFAELLGDRVGDVPVLCITAHVGACEAAIGPMSAAVALLAMKGGTVPGDLNRENPIPEYKGPSSSAAREMAVRTVLVSVMTREGINAAMVLKSV